MRALLVAGLVVSLVGCAAPGGEDGGGGGAGGAGGGAAGGGSGGGSGGGATGGGAGATDGGWWKPRPGTSWQWQLSGPLDPSFDVQVYDVDLFETTQAQLDGLHAAGRKVLCYFDTAYEPGRPDSAQLAPYQGNAVQGWPGQYWLDIRVAAVVEVMKARIALAQQKRCDGVEADDVDSRTNNPGFPITAADQQGFIRALAAEAHARGLAFALKNDLDEVTQLVGDADCAINEECFRYSECALLAPFTAAGKAVFQVEYTAGDLATLGATICPQAIALDFDTLIKHLDLGAPRFSCR